VPGSRIVANSAMGAWTVAANARAHSSGSRGRPRPGKRRTGCRSRRRRAGVENCELGVELAHGLGDEYESVVPARPVEYCFDAARSKRDAYALPGLARFGPFSRDTFARPTPRGSTSYSRRPRKARLRNSSGTCATGYPITRDIRPGSPRPSGWSTALRPRPCRARAFADPELSRCSSGAVAGRTARRGHHRGDRPRR
jgi:hypothetical protein